jgi:putative adenylate-forming enzyme
MDKAKLLQNFARLNRPKISVQEVRAALDTGQEHVRGYVVGQSTGTSGNRGLFVISEAERFTWLGVILAKTLPDFPWVRHKVALILPAYGQIFKTAAQAGLLSLRFFDLKRGVDSWAEEISRYNPDTIMAPPKVLRALAERTDIRPVNVFSGAEVLDPVDRRIIEARFGTVVREIYMATEGLFAVACPLGVLHLAEDVVAFEFEPYPGSDLVIPLVTDFTRKTQIMVRYRMNDLLRLSTQPCPCGSPLQAVDHVAGRQDDVFHLGSALTLITPDILRNAVIDADRRIDDFRIVQTGRDRIELYLAATLPPEAGVAACANLTATLREADVSGVEIKLTIGIDRPSEQKLRRVRRDWRCEEL